MKKNKIKFFILVILMTVILSSLNACSQSNKIQLNVYNWGDYVDKSLIDDFEKEYNLTVNYEEFATNEEMYIKLKQGGTNYDVAIPS